ncbi:uncharacterized protein [Acropora muricata]
MAGQIPVAEQEPVQKKSSKSRYFVWTEDHDVLMLREAVTSEPYNFKPKSSERGKVWECIAAYLNSLKTPEFRVTARAVRDRYALLISRHKLKQREEEKASGIDVPEPTELDTLLEEIREREKSAEEKIDALRNDKKAKDEKEKAAAEEIRQAAVQTMAKRKSDDNGEKPKKAKLRRSTSDAIEFLAEKSEKERELKKEELGIKKRELDLAETRQEEAAQQQQTMFSALMNQMQQQQQLQQQNLQIMLNQQNKVFMALLESIKKH